MLIDSLGIHIGGLYIRYYGLIIVTGAMAAGHLAAYEARRRKLDAAFVWDALMWTLLSGIVGARIYHVLTPPPSMMPPGAPNPYFENPIRILQIWHGGLGIPGGLLAGTVALWIFSRKHQQAFPLWGDVTVPGLFLAQAIGRWGNFVNQELYGLPSNLPWAIYIAPQNRIAAYAEYDTFHPLFLYESVLSLIGCLLLLWTARRHHAFKLQDGDLTLAYFVLYPTIRFGLEFIRVDSSQIAGINANQTLMVVVVILASLTFIFRRQRANMTSST